jgi:pimeloyl-ACP methyl ester carboxylesterase
LRQIIQKTGTNPMLVRSTEDFVKLSDFAMADPPFAPRPILAVLAQERIRNVALEERIFKALDEDTLEQRVVGLTTPTLIVWGDRDRLVRVESAEILRRLLLRSWVVVMPGVGHLPMLERPVETAADYLRFRASLQQ